MDKKQLSKYFQTIRLAEHYLNPKNENVLKELSKQGIYSNNKDGAVLLRLEEVTKCQNVLKTLANFEGRVTTDIPNNELVRIVPLPGRKYKALRNSKYIDFQIIKEVSPIPTGTERGIVKFTVAKGDKNSVILLVDNRQFAFKK